jgi:hypothetical protein
MTQYLQPPAGHTRRVLHRLADRLEQEAAELAATQDGDEVDQREPEQAERQGPPARNSQPHDTTTGGDSA